MQEITGFRLVSIGGTPITVGGVLTALLMIAAAILVARLIRSALERVRDRAGLSVSSVYIVEKLVGYAVVLAGIFAALTTLGLNLTSFAVFAGAIGVGVGLGLQGVVREFVSGLVIIFDRQANVGDFIELETGARGLIMEVGPRATRLRDNDGVDIILPNSKLIENQVTNWTLKRQTRRIHVPFSAAYGCDKSVVREAVLKAARAVPFTLPDTEARRTQVWLTGFGDSAMNFELVVWPTLEAVKRPAAMQAAYLWAIDDALRDAGWRSPFPSWTSDCAACSATRATQPWPPWAWKAPAPRRLRRAGRTTTRPRRWKRRRPQVPPRARTRAPGTPPETPARTPKAPARPP